jgi:hypothetical protein
VVKQFDKDGDKRLNAKNASRARFIASNAPIVAPAPRRATGRLRSSRRTAAGQPGQKLSDRCGHSHAPVYDLGRYDLLLDSERWEKLPLQQYGC